MQAQNQNLDFQPLRARDAGAQAVNSGLLGATLSAQVHDNVPIFAPGPPLIGGKHPPPQGCQESWAKARSFVPPLLLGRNTEIAANSQHLRGAILREQEITPQVTNIHVTTSGNMLAGGNSEGFRSAGSAEVHGAIDTPRGYSSFSSSSFHECFASSLAAPGRT